MPYRDPDDQRKYMRRHYQANRQTYLDRAKASNARSRAAKREALLAAKDQPCMDCGGQLPPHSMEFDHVRGDKRAAVSNMVHSNSWTVADLMEEISKCEVVCVVCHRERHARGY